ncbi:DUF2798 domain-containing protein [Pedobacter immunditicola]|uniref:DUF2798 domain-containing protein n=1 Tax=Pedobacter immunditicola TaxID=3133440 RepID=UPI00309EBA5C
MKKKYLKYINTLFVVFPMTLIMAFVGIARNHGFVAGLFSKALNAWMVMFPVAYLAAFIIIPVAGKLTHRLSSKVE